MTSLYPRVKGILTDCITGIEREVQLRFKVDDGIFHLIGGPTGYESFYIDSNFDHLEEICISGWCACMGTPGEWDKLVIPGMEMERVLLESIGDFKCQK